MRELLIVILLAAAALGLCHGIRPLVAKLVRDAVERENAEAVEEMNRRFGFDR